VWRTTYIPHLQGYHKFCKFTFSQILCLTSLAALIWFSHQHLPSSTHTTCCHLHISHLPTNPLPYLFPLPNTCALAPIALKLKPLPLMECTWRERSIKMGPNPFTWTMVCTSPVYTWTCKLTLTLVLINLKIDMPYLWQALLTNTQQGFKQHTSMRIKTWHMISGIPSNAGSVLPSFAYHPSIPLLSCCDIPLSVIFVSSDEGPCQGAIVGASRECNYLWHVPIPTTLYQEQWLIIHPNPYEYMLIR
jgi:hypothetical protein